MARSLHYQGLRCKIESFSFTSTLVSLDAAQKTLNHCKIHGDSASLEDTFQTVIQGLAFSRTYGLRLWFTGNENIGVAQS